MTPEKFHDIEQHLAYEHAASLIDGMTAPAPLDKYDQLIWHDLSDADCDLSSEVAYLDHRRLIDRHPDNSQWIQVREENNPLPAAEGQV